METILLGLYILGGLPERPQGLGKVPMQMSYRGPISGQAATNSQDKDHPHARSSQPGGKCCDT